MRKFRVLINGNEYRVDIEEIYEEIEQKFVDSKKPESKEGSLSSPPNMPKTEVTGIETGQINASMPGTILDVLVAVGDRVEKGATLLTLEAMKMENEVVAPQGGVVLEVHVGKGSSVDSGDLLMRLA